MSRRVRQLRALPELWLARLALAVIPRLPRPAVVRLSRILAALALVFDRRGRRVAEANLQLVFPDRPPCERKRILATSLRSFALSMLEVFWLARDAEKKIEHLLELDPSFERLKTPAPAICLTAHMGNWEALGLGISHITRNPLVSVAATIKNPKVDELFLRLRQLTGQIVVPRKGAVRALLKALREGRKIALVMDQNTAPSEGGIFVNFLGLPAPMSTAPALLALRTGAPILISATVPTPGGTYRTLPIVEVASAVPGASQDEAVRIITQRISDALSAMIRAHPEAWVWAYKRWRLRPPDTPAEMFPFYSEPLEPEVAAPRYALQGKRPDAQSAVVDSAEGNSMDRSSKTVCGAPGSATESSLVSPPSGSASKAAAGAIRRLAVFLVVACLGIWASHYTRIGEYFNVYSIEQLADRFGSHGIAIIFVLGIVTPLMFLPRWPIAFLAGLVYGVGWGTLLSTAASTIGAWLHFMLSRTLLAPASERVKKRLGLENVRIPRDKQFMALFLLRAFPLSSFVATNVLAGALRLSRGRFFVATFFGMLPSSWMYAAWGKLMKKPDPQFYGLAVVTVAMIVLGAVAAQRYLAPYFRPPPRGGPE